MIILPTSIPSDHKGVFISWPEPGKKMEKWTASGEKCSHRQFSPQGFNLQKAAVMPPWYCPTELLAFSSIIKAGSTINN
jgi:hypothetical protein